MQRPAAPQTPGRAEILAHLGWLLFTRRRETAWVRALAEEGLALLVGERETAEALFVPAAALAVVAR